MTRIGVAVLATAALMLAGTASAQQQPATPPAPPLIDWAEVEIKTIDLGNKTYMLQGQGGNITVAVGSDGSTSLRCLCQPDHLVSLVTSTSERQCE